MLLGAALLLLAGATALPRGSGGMRGHFVRAQNVNDVNASPLAHQALTSEGDTFSSESGRRDESAIPHQTSFLRPSPVQSAAPAGKTPTGADSASPHWGRRVESTPQLDSNEDFQTSRQPFYPILSYSTKREDSGAYSYRFETADGLAREETSDVDLERSSGSDDVTNKGNNENIKRVVRGWYSYPSPNGEALIRVDYIADENGFRATQTEQTTVSRPTQRLYGVEPKPSRDDSYGETGEPSEQDRPSYSTNPSIYYRQLGQGGFFYSYRAPNSLQ